MKISCSFSVMFVMVLCVPHVEGDTTLIDFESPVPGTIQDSNGEGTGLTHRLPGTGTASSLLPNDPNLLLLPPGPGTGQLSITSTYADISQPLNLDMLEALGLYCTNTAGKDIVVEALFRNVQLNEGSDQLGLYTGIDTDSNIRGGLHRSFPDMIPQYFLNDQHVPLDGVTDFVTPEAEPADWSNGDDVLLTLSRISGQWSLSWDNQSTGDNGTSPSFAYPWLDASDDLYFGINYASARSDDPFFETSKVEYFSVTIIPEPSSIMLALLGIVGLPGMLWRRRRYG